MNTRLRRALLVLLDLEDPTAERDWQGMEAELQELTVKVRAAEEERDSVDGVRAVLSAALEARHNDLIRADERFRTELAEERKARRAEMDLRVRAEKALRDATRVEHVSAVTALQELLAEIDCLLPPKGELVRQQEEAPRYSCKQLRALRMLVTRGLNNDAAFLSRHDHEAGQK